MPATPTSLTRWNELWVALGAQGDAAAWHRRLSTAYSEPERHYHTLQHLSECLTELDGARASAAQPDHLAVTLWFHDAVYDPHSPTNEEDSAALAVECLTAAHVTPSAITHIRDLILCTKTHDPAAVADAALLIDIDLAILGQPTPRFWEYESAIRAEYAWVPSSTYAEKRSALLSRFLQRPSLYRTEPFRTRYEAAAHANLTAAIARLRASSSA